MSAAGAVVLAAGASERLGRPKQLELCGGRIRGGSTRSGLPTRLLVGVDAERVVDELAPRRA